MSAAADHSAHGVASATAALSAVGYLAYLAGPPIVGLAADHVDLTSTITTVAVTAAAMVAVATFRLPQQQPRLP